MNESYYYRSFLRFLLTLNRFSSSREDGLHVTIDGEDHELDVRAYQLTATGIENHWFLIEDGASKDKKISLLRQKCHNYERIFGEKVHPVIIREAGRKIYVWLEKPLLKILAKNIPSDFKLLPLTE